MEYTIKQLTFDNNDDALLKLVNLQNIVYEGRHSFSIEGFESWYLKNPMGKVISFNAFHGEELVAHYACIPYEMEIKGKRARGLLDMATVTHPNHRGKGLFKKLAIATFDFAQKEGYEFVLGVANANSYPGYMKHFPFKDYGQLKVKIGIGLNIFREKEKPEVYVSWSKESIDWRMNLRSRRYYRSENIILSSSKVPFFKLIIGLLPESLINTDTQLYSKRLLRPFNLYVGLGAQTKKGIYFTVPKFIKRSPFHLIFMDLTDGKLPKFSRDDMFFQLIDFDVA